MHRAERERRRGRRRRSGLALVADGAPVDVAPDGGELADVEDLPRGLADVVRADLDALLSSHPARDTLAALAGRLAEAADSPSILLDPRALPPIVRELRATIRDLVEHEEGEDDDLFGDDEDLPTAMVDPAAG